MVDLSKTLLNPSLGETFQVESPHMFPPMLLPSHHQIPQTHLPKLVMTVLVCLKPTPNSSQRRIGMTLVVPPLLLSSLIEVIDKQWFVSSLSLLIGRMMMVAFPIERLGRNKLLQDNSSCKRTNQHRHQKEGRLTLPDESP